MTEKERAALGRLNKEQNRKNVFTNITPADIRREIEKEENG